MRMENDNVQYALNDKTYGAYRFELVANCCYESPFLYLTNWQLCFMLHHLYIRTSAIMENSLSDDIADTCDYLDEGMFTLANIIFLKNQVHCLCV